MKPKTRLVLIVLSTAIGACTLLLFTTLVKDVFFRDVYYCLSNMGDLSIKTSALFTAGAVVGFKSSLIVLRKNFWPHALISMGVILQLFFISTCPVGHNPLWFDVLENFSLVVGLWSGSYLAMKFPLAPI